MTKWDSSRHMLALIDSLAKSAREDTCICLDDCIDCKFRNILSPEPYVEFSAKLKDAHIDLFHQQKAQVHHLVRFFVQISR